MIQLYKSNLASKFYSNQILSNVLSVMLNLDEIFVRDTGDIFYGHGLRCKEAKLASKDFKYVSSKKFEIFVPLFLNADNSNWESIYLGRYLTFVRGL